MTDVRGFSRILEEEGEAHGARLIRAYERFVRAALSRKTFEVDHIADAFHLVFPTPTQALRTAMSIAESLQRHNKRHPDLQIPVAFGIESGQGIRQRSHFVGAAPVVAARLAHRARPGQILVGEAAFALLRASKVGPMRDLGVWQPSGGQAMHLYEARAPDPRADGSREVERFLTALLFTDIVGSTAKAAEIGAQHWTRLVEEHHGIVRDELRRHRGMEIDTAGDGFYASFDAPSRAIDCGLAICDRVHALGIDVRVGVHAGECEIVAGKVGGMTVTISARIKDQGGPGEVLVSQTVRDLLAGASYDFVDQGRRALKGVPGEWTIYKIGT